MAAAAPLVSSGAEQAASSRGVEDCGAGPVATRPKTMILTCADDGELAEHLTWSSWTATHASAAGIVTWRACTARCADSRTWDRAAARVSLTDPVAEPGKGVLFTRLRLQVTGFTPAGFLRDLTFSEAPVTAAPPPSAGLAGPRRFAPSGSLGYAQIEGFWDDAGGPSSQTGSGYTDDQIAAAITGAESSFLPGIIQPGVDYCGAGADRAGWGLWQITCGNSVPSQYGSDFQLLDPWNNAEGAVAKYDAAGGFSPWSTYTDGAYAQYLQHTAADTQLTDPGEYVQINATPPGTPSSPPADPGSTYGPPLNQIRLVGDVTYAPGSVGSAQELFGRDSAGDTWEAWENSSGGWSGWHSLGGVVASDITYAPGSNGSVQEIFARNAAGTVYEDWENSSGGWAGWHSLGGTVSGEVTYAPGANGSVQELFAHDPSGTPYENWENSNGTWHGWVSLGGTIASNITYGAVGAYQEVWARNSAGTVYVDLQYQGRWSGWVSLGGGAVGDVTWAPGVPGAAQEVFARTSAGTPYGNVQTSAGWTGWISMGGTITSDMAYAPGSVGSSLELFAHNGSGTVYEDWWGAGGWSGWVSRGGDLGSNLSYAPGSNGSVQEIFGVSGSGSVFEAWENSDGSWSDWHNLGP